ncbi:hypothetical protein H696_02841 [Fonticula alba]|uniref:Uncharacterized protein n=1 Tax=Fonticula alba TaxID=691883 RepID=A0A058Z8E0_FONAL|nr:hypothetical protein H696_02841 [Fonticula alba]KCV70500.1 hypothetical protein H696_02841 [Fonticula alba]|eukprot:XP_009495016.1 hypothetical protein H696_02841 [Fonticula alba]
MSDEISVQHLGSMVLTRFPFVEFRPDQSGTLPTYEYTIANTGDMSFRLTMTFEGENVALEPLNATKAQLNGPLEVSVTVGPKDPVFDFVRVAAADKSGAGAFSFGAGIRAVVLDTQRRSSESDGVILHTSATFNEASPETGKEHLHVTAECENTRSDPIEVHVDLLPKSGSIISTYPSELPFIRVIPPGQRVNLGTVLAEDALESVWHYVPLVDQEEGAHPPAQPATGAASVPAVAAAEDAGVSAPAPVSVPDSALPADALAALAALSLAPTSKATAAPPRPRTAAPTDVSPAPAAAAPADVAPATTADSAPAPAPAPAAPAAPADAAPATAAPADAAPADAAPVAPVAPASPIDDTPPPATEAPSPAAAPAPVTPAVDTEKPAPPASNPASPTSPTSPRVNVQESELQDVRLRQTITSSPGSTNVTFEAVNGRARPVEVTLDVDVDSGNIEDVVDFGIYTERPFKAQIQPGETGLIASVHVRAAIGINWGFREIAPSSGPASPAE